MGEAGNDAAQAKPGEPLHETLLRYYREMLLIRRFEERAGQLYGMGLIGGFCHLYIGQEAVIIGVKSALKDGDAIITGYRDHGHMLACGIDPKAVMAELAGRAGGISGGKGGSMHMFSLDHGFYGGHGIVAAQVPLGTGIAFAAKYQGDERICATFLGDGAANQGQFFEAMNMAKLWSLPVLYVIENNRYAMGTSVKRATGAPELFRRGAGFDIPGDVVDGMDVAAVHRAAATAAASVREGKGPFILELQTYRYRGHSMSDPAKYRSKEEVEDVREHHDPIKTLSATLVSTGKVTEDELKEIDKEIRARIVEAAEYAQQSPEPDPDALYTDVLAEA